MAGTSEHTIYYRDEVQVPPVPRLYGILGGYGSESATTLDSDVLGKIPHARNPRGNQDPGKKTVFLLPEPRSALARSTNLECTHLIVSKMVLFATARGRGDLAAGCMVGGQGGPNLGEILKNLGAIKLTAPRG